MRKAAILAAAGVLALGSFSASDAEARSRRGAGAVVAAGVVGLAAGAIIAGSASRAYAAPAPYYGYAAPVASYQYGYDDGYYAAPVVRERRVVRYYEEPRPVYRPRRVVETYEYAPVRSRAVTYSYGSPYYGAGYYGGW